jgi:hypothetical protein
MAAATDLILRNTYLNFFCTCPKKFYYAARRSLFTLKKPLPFDIGGLTHEGLKVLHHPLHKTRPMTDRLEMALKQVKNLASTVEAEAEHDEGFDINDVTSLLRGYAAEYPKDTGNVLAVEQSISFPMAEGIYYRGTVDMLERSSHGELIMWEHKTSRALSNSVIQMYIHSPQTLGYAYCLKEVLNEDVAYIVINLLMKTKKPSFHREKVLTQKVYLNQWRQWAERKGAEIQRCIQTDVWEENRYACYPWVGKPCAYVPLCFYGESPQTLSFFRQEGAQGPSDTLVGDAD